MCDQVCRAQHSPLFYDVCSSFSLCLLKAPAISQVRPEPIRCSLAESMSLSLSLPVCLSLEPSLSALTLCHLTALPSNQALKGNLKRLTRQKKTSLETDTTVQTGNMGPFHSLLTADRTVPLLGEGPRWPGLLFATQRCPPRHPLTLTSP